MHAEYRYALATQTEIWGKWISKPLKHMSFDINVEEALKCFS